MSDNRISENMESKFKHEPINKVMQDPKKVVTIFSSATDRQDPSLSATLVLTNEGSKTYRLMIRD